MSIQIIHILVGWNSLEIGDKNPQNDFVVSIINSVSSLNAKVLEKLPYKLALFVKDHWFGTSGLLNFPLRVPGL
jgi:hypothetical protein